MGETVELRPGPKQSFSDLLESFSRYTWMTTSLHGFKDNDSYQAIVAMGEKAIPRILYFLERPGFEPNKKVHPEKPSLWIALALDDITGQDITGYAQLGGDVDAMTERALDWAEKESFLPIRSDEKSYQVGSELFDLLLSSALSHPDAKEAMARSFTDNVDLDRRLAHFPINGRDMVLEFRGGRRERSLTLTDTDPSLYRSGLSVELIQDSESGRYAAFEAPGEAVSGTWKAADDFRKAVGEIFNPQPPLARAA